MDPAQPSFPETAFSDTEAVVFYYYCYLFLPQHSFSCGISESIQIFQSLKVEDGYCMQALHTECGCSYKVSFLDLPVTE